MKQNVEWSSTGSTHHSRARVQYDTIEKGIVVLERRQSIVDGCRRIDAHRCTCEN